MSIWIKNDSGTTKTWVGQQLSDQAYYEISSIDELKWSSDSTLLVDVANADAVVAKDGSGNTDIADVNEAINYLKNKQALQIDTTTAPIHQYGISEANQLRARLIGIFNETATKNSTTDHDWKIPAVSYGGSDKQSLMNGIQYYAKDAEIGDELTFQVVDVDNILGYGAGAVLDEFGKSWKVIPDSEQEIVLYKAKLIKDLYIRIKYASVGTTNDVKLICNLYRHIDTDIDV